MAIQKPCNVCRFLTGLSLTVLNTSLSWVTKETKLLRKNSVLCTDCLLPVFSLQY